MAREGAPASAKSPTTAEPLHLVLIGVNHRTCPIGEREDLLKQATYPRFRKTAGPHAPWDDLLLLATCNRIEVYAATRTPAEAMRSVSATLGIPPSAPAAYTLEGEAAAAHLLRVSCGLDSIAQGEAQVAAQIRKAASLRPPSFRRTVLLATLFERAAREAPRLRALAGLTEDDRSASHAALAYIRTAVPLSHPTIALLGTGKMARIAAASLMGRSRVLVVNRDPRRARDVARRLKGRGVGLEGLDRVLGAADIVIAATSTTKPLVTRRRLESIRKGRGDRPQWFIDLGFPRNIDPSCRDLPNVTVIDIDGLAPWGSRPLPPAALARAEARIRQEAERLVGELQPASAADIAFLRKTAEEIRRNEVDEALSRLPNLSGSERAVVDKLSARLVNRFLHGPTERLRTLPEETRNQLVRELLRGMGGQPR